MKNTVIVVFALFMYSCSTSVNTSGGTNSVSGDCTPNEFLEAKTYDADIASIMTSSCVSCHGDSNPSGGLSLTSYQDVLSSVSAGSPSASELYARVVSTGSDKMPPSGSLTTTEQEAISDWIDLCAPEN
jgi:uncharacterized membrane protein